MAAQQLTVRLTRGDAQPWGFRLQGGKDFGTPLLIQKVNSGTLADQVGLVAGDAVIKINGTNVFDLRHKDAQDVVVKAGNNVEVTIQRGGSTWKPNVTPTGNLPSPNQYGGPGHVTKTSLAHVTPDGRPISAIGTGYNNAARPFNSPSGAPVKSIVNKQYNTPVGIYSDETIAETLSAQAEVLAGGVLGVNFKKNEKMYNSANSEVYKMLQEQQNDPEEPAPQQQETHRVTPQPTTRPLPHVHVHQPNASVTKHVTAPIDRPIAPQSNGLPPGQNICAECERLIVGVFVRIKDKNLHAECFKCATCGSSLKNQGYYNLNNKLYCDVHAKLAAVQHPPKGTQGYTPVPIKPDTKLGANIIQAALNSKSANYNGTSQNHNNGYIITPTHSRTNSSDSSRSLTSKTSLINSNRTTPSQSGKSSPILNGIKSEIIINLTDRLDGGGKISHDVTSIDENDYRKYNLCFQTLNGGTIRSVKPPGKGYDTQYKINNPYAAPKPYNYSQPPMAGPKSPSSYPPSAPSWTQPHDHQVNQGKFNTFGSSYQELCCAQEICNVLSNVNVTSNETTNNVSLSPFNWPPTTKSSVVDDSGRFTPTASPLYIQPPETVHYEARVHTQTSSTIQQQQKLQQETTSNTNLSKSTLDLESSSESYTSTSTATTVSSSEEQQKNYQTSLTYANQMNNTSDIDLNEYDLSKLQHYKMSLCSSEVNGIIGRRSVQECADSVSNSINTQQLIDAVKEFSPRPASPIPKPYKRVEFANEKPLPKEVQAITEGCQTIDGTLGNDDEEEAELIDLRSEELDDDEIVEKFHIPETKPISPTNIPNPVPQKYQSEMLKALKAEGDKAWRPVSTPTIEIEDYEQHNSIRESQSKSMTKLQKQMTTVTETTSSMRAEEKSAIEEVCVKKQASTTTDQVTPVIEVKTPCVEPPKELPKCRSMASLLTTAPSQPVEFVPKPSHEPVPLPDVTVPYIPPPIPMTPIIREDDSGRSKTPLHSALIIAPSEPYSPFGKEVSSQLDDLPRPDPNMKTTMAGALTVAPDRSYTPFTSGPEQIYTCCVSEPVYTETNTMEAQSSMCTSEIQQSSAFANVNGVCSTSTFKPRLEALNWFNSTPLPYCAQKSEPVWSSETACRITEDASTNVCSQSATKIESSAVCCKKPIQQPYQHPTTLSYQKKPYYSGLHKPDEIPSYQKDLMKLPSQTPVRPPESPQLRENVPIAFLDTPEYASNLHKPIAISASNQSSQNSPLQNETQLYVENKSLSFAENRTGTITMAFQSLDQYDDQQHQKSFTPTNRPVTPSLINKPAPTIPYYQQNLCPIECKPTESHVFDPRSRSPSPHPDRAKSPAPGPPPNPLRAVCPRIKERPVPQINKKLECEIKTEVAEKAEQKTHSLVGFKNTLPSQQQNLTKPQYAAVKPITTYTSASSQFADVKDAANYNIEKHASAAKFTEIPKTVQQQKIGDMNIQTTVQGSSMNKQNKSEKQTSQTTNVGNVQIQRRTRVVEEFERSRSEKQMEIVKTQGDMARRVTFEQKNTGNAITANSNSSAVKKEGFVAGQARRLSKHAVKPIEGGTNTKLFPITIDLSGQMTQFPHISSSPKVRDEENMPRIELSPIPFASSIGSMQSGVHAKSQSESSYQAQQKHEKQMTTLTRQVQQQSAQTIQKQQQQQFNRQEQQKSIASSSARTDAYTNSNQQQKQLSSYKKFETAPTTAMNVTNKYPSAQPISNNKAYYSPMSKIQSNASVQSTPSQKLTQQKYAPNAVVSDSSPASAGSTSNKGGAFGATTAPRRGRGTLNMAVGPGVRIPLCGCCNTQIRGPFITALGRIWCPDHFVCSTSNCKRPLQDIGFVEEKNQLYCEFCFEKYLAPSCSKCNSKIKGDCLNAIGKHFHPECFTCAYCGKLFGNSPFFLEEGDPYCEADWNELFTTKCFACGFPVEAGDRWVEALSNNYHSQCFNCSMCKKNLEGQSFVAKGGRPFCKNHAR